MFFPFYPEKGLILNPYYPPDMRIPIQYALYYPSRPALSGDRLDLFNLKDLTFEAPDLDLSLIHI